jgi:hypothetical protein
MAPNLPASVNGSTIATESQVEPLPETTTLPPTRFVPAIAHPTPEDAFGVAANIKYHAQYSPHFSPFKFDPEQAFYSTAESVRDALIQVPVYSLCSFLFETYHQFSRRPIF